MVIRGIDMPKPKGKTLGKTVRLFVTSTQYDQGLSYGRKPQDGGYQKTFGDVIARNGKVGDRFYFDVYTTVIDELRKYAARTDSGGYQRWCRDVLTANNIT